MLQIRTTVDNENIFLDLYQNEPIVLSLSFAELQDITKKNSAFSKSFSLPGSKRNNTVFNFFFDLNAVPTTFNPNDKFEASLLWDGTEILTGNIRLNGVSISNGEIIYQVTFYNQIGDLMSNIGDKFLVDLNLSGLSHPYTESVILESNLDPNLFPLTGGTNYSYQNGKTMWGLFNIGYEYSGSTLRSDITPLVQFSPTVSGTSYNPTTGNFDYSGTPVNDYYYKPAIQVKELYTQIVNQAGYQVESSFFDTSYFEKFYLPLKFVDETVYARNAIPACFSFTNQDLGQLDYYTPIFPNPSSGQTCNSLNFPTTSTTFDIPSVYSGLYEFSFTFTVIPDQPCDYDLLITPSVQFFYNDTVQTIQLYNNEICDGQPTTINLRTFINITGTTTNQLYFYGDYASISGFTSSIVNGPRFMISGSTIDYSAEFPPNDYKQIDFVTSINKYFNLIVVPDPDKPKNLIIEPIVDYVGKGPVLDWTTKVDFKQTQSLYPTTSLLNGTLEFEFKKDQDYANQDFFTQSNRIFGTDKFLLGQDYKDTTTKFDYIFSSPIDITINNAFVPQITLSSFSKLKQIDVSGQTLQTFVPFKILPRLVFRGLTLPVDNYGFIGGSGSTAPPSIFCTSGITINVTAPGYLRYNDCSGNQTYEYVGTGSKTYSSCLNASTFGSGVPYPSVATYTITSSGTTCNIITSQPYQYWWMNEYQQDRFTNINRFTTYPFAYTGFSHYINFRGEDSTNITPGEYIFDSEDLYNIYYQPYVDDLINIENKIYACKMYLYPQDIQQLRWNERILINNTYFRINRITNYNASEPSICDVELVKLTKDYEEHRRLYYKFEDCASGPDLYSSSDLNYNLYAYVGNYVTLYNDNLEYLGCYNVSIEGYDPTHNYQHYYISSGYTGNLVGVYPDCGCTGRTQFNVVQEEPGTARLFTYIGTGCTDLNTYIFRSSDSFLPSGNFSYTITNTATTETICVYNVENYFSQITNWIQENAYVDCEACAQSFITPTPTPTMGLTPTPTPTRFPNPCICMEVVITSDGGDEGYSGAIEYNDCYGNFTGRIFRRPGTYYQCVERIGGLNQIEITFGTGTLSPVGNCATGSCPPPVTPTQTSSNTPTPTPSSTIGTTPPNTPTPTQTPTVTNTPSMTPTQSGECLEYRIENNTESSISISWHDCDDIVILDSLGSGNQITFCSNTGFGPIETGGGTLFTLGPCSTTPTPTPTLTQTPTPTSATSACSCYCLTYTTVPNDLYVRYALCGTASVETELIQSLPFLDNGDGTYTACICVKQGGAYQIPVCVQGGIEVTCDPYIWVQGSSCTTYSTCFLG